MQNRLRKRLDRHSNEIFTFLDYPGVTADNNHAERRIRPAVVSRKTSYGNRSKQGADVQAMLMSIFRTLELRGYEPVNTLLFLVQEHLRTGKPMTLPPPLPLAPVAEQPQRAMTSAYVELLAVGEPGAHGGGHSLGASAV